MAQRIYRRDFNKTLKHTPGISREERGYLNRVFGRKLIDGLTPFELKQKTRELYSNKKDVLDRWELRRVKNKLLKKMGK